MLINGEKFACEACVRGHRVSTCQHSDRQLTHINKKGRPVSQCPHCRGLRKARASHVQCDCGAKSHSKEECIDNEGTNESGETHSDHGSDQGPQDLKTCCCTHGMRCTCALKKEYLDPVPEIDLPLIPPRRPTSSRKPRLLKADSDNSLTVFTNGHHKPVHKHNDSAHQCGLPYKIPIPHSVPSKECARRSTDSLPLIRKKEEIHSQLHDSISSAQQEVRLVRSEHGSPEPRASRYRNDNGQLPPLDLSYPGYNENAPGQYPEDYAQSPGGFENYYTSQEDLPVLSAGASGPPVDWSAMDLPLDNGGFSTVYSQPPSYASFEHSNVDRPGLTASSSGEYSEVDDYIPNNNKHSPLGPDRTTRSASTSADELNYNQYSSSFPDLSLASVHSPNNLSELDMHTFLRSTASPTVFEEPRGGMPLSSEAFAKHGLSVHDAQKMAHPDTPTEAMGGLSLPPHVHDVDHVWAPPHFESSEDSLTPECKVEDDEWHQ